MTSDIEREHGSEHDNDHDHDHISVMSINVDYDDEDEEDDSTLHMDDLDLRNFHRNTIYERNAFPLYTALAKCMTVEQRSSPTFM